MGHCAALCCASDTLGIISYSEGKKACNRQFALVLCSGSLSIQKMKQLKMKVSEAKLKVLQHLSLVELDKKGHVRLVM